MELPILTDEQTLLGAYVTAEITAINERSGQIGDDILTLRANVIAYAAARGLRYDPEPFAVYAYLDDDE